MKLALCLLGSCLLFGCGTDGPNWVPGFDPGDAPQGYTRFVTPTVTNIKPGADLEWCQWVADADTVARDVMAVQGLQSATGHHAVLYATTAIKKIGESHECTVDDMIPISFVGAIGGEGNAGDAAALPEGLNFRLPAGQALMLNSHWLNTTDEPVDGQAVIDVKFEPASDTRVIADLFANNGDMIEIPANGTQTLDVNCVMPHDMSFAMVTNHMHNYGATAYTEIVRTNGAKEMIVEDPVWSPEEQFSPRYQRFSKDAPKVLHAGDTLHTHCEWKNTTATPQYFPDEMCVGTGFYFPSQGQIVCENGSFGGR